MSLGNVLKYTGKTIATIACPPFGLALWSKRGSDKFGAAFLGAIISVFSAFPIVLRHDKQIYDNPELNLITKLNSPLTLPAMVSSPLGLYLGTHPKIQLQGEQLYAIKGEDAVFFRDGKYHLDFGKERSFGEAWKYKNVEKAEERVEEYRQVLGKYLENGNVLEARKAREKLQNAQTNLESTFKEYNETKRAFQEAINKMNSELENLANNAEQTAQ